MISYNDVTSWNSFVFARNRFFCDFHVSSGTRTDFSNGQIMTLASDQSNVYLIGVLQPRHLYIFIYVYYYYQAVNYAVSEQRHDEF